MKVSINKMKKNSLALLASGIFLATMAAPIYADDSLDRGKSISNQQLMTAIEGSFQVNNENEWKRFSDPTLATCNETLDKPTAQQTQEILKRERASIKLPDHGKYVGDWEQGLIWAEATHGGRIGVEGFVDADDASKPNGGNCYACHAIDPNFPQNGNMGPDLTNYGKIRGNSEAIQKYTYEKIFNAKAIMPCSLMPRYGHGEGHLLTAEQIADVTAFLLDPKSPVNNPKRED